jgi:phytoene dehydrogenase-like protein
MGGALPEKKIAIIGAGIAGLAAGCYARMNGYGTTIFELHDKPGGLCTAWTRKGYTFDGAIRWLMGSAPGTSLYSIWEELGVVQNRRMVNHELFVQVEDAGGKALRYVTDIDRLEQNLHEISPGDGKLIRSFARTARNMIGFTEVPMDRPREASLMGSIRMMSKVMPVIGAMRKYGRITVREFAQGFHDPFLREAFPWAFYVPELPAIVPPMHLAWMHRKMAGYPVGGSLGVARAIERRFLDLGGSIHYRSRVTKVLVADDRAVGVRLSDGTEFRADIVISAADGHATIFGMLEGKYLDDRLRALYRDYPPYKPFVQVSLGITRDLSAEPHFVNFPLGAPISIVGEPHSRLALRHFCYDPTMAPPGRSAVHATFISEHEPWRRLHEDRVKYDDEKKRIADATLAALERRWHGIGSQVEVVDVATPMTYERYTGNWQGSPQGFFTTPATLKLSSGKPIGKTLPGLESFYLCGQWTEVGNGGTPSAAFSARNAIWDICRSDNCGLTASKPAEPRP